MLLFRRGTERNPHRQVELLLANLPNLTAALLEGSIVVLDQTRVRIRSLPIDFEEPGKS